MTAQTNPAPAATGDAGQIGRECGDCSMCCKLLPEPELSKQANEWCRHCRPGKGGCLIHATRPAGCREFACEWLRGELGDAWYPARSKIVVRSYYDAEHGVAVLEFVVDRAYPNRWREEPFHALIRHASAVGLTAAEVFLVQVVAGNDIFFVLPDREIRRSIGDHPEEAKRAGIEFDAAMRRDRRRLAPDRRPRPAAREQTHEDERKRMNNEIFSW